MRVTTEQKEKTRQRILDCARNLFQDNGFQETTTRDIATAAQVAVGTMFNYFPTKEALAMTFVRESLELAQQDFADRRREGASLEEELFSLVATALRRLEPMRRYVAPVLETAMSPFSQSTLSAEGDAVRTRQLELASEVILQHRVLPEHNFITMHLYWTLYLGVLAFWTRDESSHQEDTLVILDRSTRLFASSLQNGASTAETPDVN
jgi:AcrR family transcriptional regulator